MLPILEVQKAVQRASGEWLQDLKMPSYGRPCLFSVQKNTKVTQLPCKQLALCRCIGLAFVLRESRIFAALLIHFS